MSARPLACAALVVTALLAGCLGDPPPDPETAPLEVVVGSRKAPDRPCLLNRHEVGAGLHDVDVFAQGGSATVVIRGRGDAGRPVFEASLPRDRVPAEVLAEDPPPGGALIGTHLLSVQLDAGEYVVECTTPAGPAGTAPLRVTPARPGR